MYSNRDKIVKKGKKATTETEDEVAKALFELENNAKVEDAEAIKKIKITKAEILAEKDKKVLQIEVPHTLYALARKCHTTLTSHLEAKFKCPVVILAQRTILSKYGKDRVTMCREAEGIAKATNEQNLDRGARRIFR